MTNTSKLFVPISSLQPRRLQYLSNSPPDDAEREHTNYLRGLDYQARRVLLQETLRVLMASKDREGRKALAAWCARMARALSEH